MLDAEYPGLKTYLSHEDEVMLQPVGEDSEVHFLPSIAGG